MHFLWYYFFDVPWASDLLLRYNEIACDHTGIDSFDIFERKITSEEFCGIDRPDKPKEERNGRNRVHAYPAWHTAVFWWYGYVPRSVCIAIMAILYACSLIWICKWISERLQEKDRFYYMADILFLLSMSVFPFLGVCCFMNYGLFLAGCALLVFTLLQCKHEVLAGIVFSLIMIKPQIGIPLLIPLFINRNYKTIAVAGAICIMETLFAAWKLDKSPVELILQIPQIGAPFLRKDFFGRIAAGIFGAPGSYVSMGLFLAIASAGSFFVRNAKDIWVRFLPAIAIIPFWVYSQFHDWIILLPCYFYIVKSREKYPVLYDLSFCLLFLWGVFTFCNLVEWYLIGKQGIASALHLAIVAIGCFMAISDTNEKWNMSLLNIKKRRARSP